MANPLMMLGPGGDYQARWNVYGQSLVRTIGSTLGSPDDTETSGSSAGYARQRRRKFSGEADEAGDSPITRPAIVREPDTFEHAASTPGTGADVAGGTYRLRRLPQGISVYVAPITVPQPAAAGVRFNLAALMPSASAGFSESPEFPVPPEYSLMVNLTPKQLHILTRIRDLRLTRGYSPTLQELADELRVSKVTVFEHVEALIRKGALKRRPNKARSLELDPRADMPDEQRNTKLPYVGTIAAGTPIEAVEDRQYLDLEDLFAAGRGQSGQSGPSGGAGDRFVLKVRGDSMIDEQIRHGDYVIVERRSTPRNGETVVALLDNGEATLKKFYREQGKVRLQPANKNFQPIIVKDVKIQGVVVGVVRKYR